MNKSAFLSRLEDKLRVLPESERTDALEYYDGYFNDAENESAAIAELGSPGEVAANILASYVAQSPHDTSARKEGMSGIKIAWITLLAFFALPIGLPIIIGLAIIPLTVFIVLGSLIFSFAVSSVASFASGIVMIISFPFVIFQDFGQGLILGGTGVMSIGFSILFMCLVRFLLKGFPMIARFAAKKILRRGQRGR